MKRLYTKRMIISALIYLNAYFIGSNMKGFLATLLLIPFCMLCIYLPSTFKED